MWGWVLTATLLTLVAPPPAAAQSGTITGRITDAHSGAPLAGADVVVQATTLHALTRADGRFLLVGVPVGTHTLQVLRVGYGSAERTVTVTTTAPTVVDFALPSQPLDLEELVVTGAAGSVRRREVASAVAQLDLGEVTARPATISDFLQGGAVGVEVTGGSGEAGQGKRIRLRGNSSISLSNQPLIYIDGVRMMDGAFPATVLDQTSFLPNGANVTSSPLDIINVADIDRIEVVKGPAATTLFGTGAASGVIQIFTKRGSAGPPIWSAEIQQGTGWVRPFGANGVDYLHVEHYMRDAWWGGGYDGGAEARDCVVDDPRWEGVNASPDGGCSWPGAQWYQTYRLGVSGGGERIDYYVSGEYQDDTFTLPLDRLKKHGVRANLRATLLPSLELQSHTAYTNMWTRNTASGTGIESILLNSMRGNRNYLSSADPTVIVQLFDFRNDQWIDRLTSGLTATYTQSASLTHRLTAGYDLSRQDLRSLREFGYFFAAEGSVTARTWQRTVRTLDYLGQLRVSVGGDVASTVSVGGQLIHDDISSLVETGQGFTGPGITEPAAADDYESFRDEGATLNSGVFAQNVLDVSNRYFFTAGARLDVHQARGETFVRLHPKVGATWVVSDESFWPTSLGALRLRSAYGRSGSAADPFQQAVRWRGAPPDDPGAGGVLEPETTTEWEVGFDGALLDDRLAIGFTYYRQTTSDALVSVEEDVDTIPRRIDLENIGTIQNRGVELQVDAALVRSGDWSLDLGLGVTTNHSEVLDLGGAEPFTDLGGNLMEGEPVPVHVGRKVADPDAVIGPWTNQRYVQDASGTEPANLALGAQLPTHYVSPSVSLRVPGGVVISARGEYRGGNVRLVNPVPVGRSVISPLCMPYYVDATVSTDLRPDTPDLWQERCTPSAGSDYWFDADYFKLRTVTATIPVGFAFPDAVRESTLTLALENAWTWYRHVPWWDLEILPDEGVNADGLGSTERVPAPVRVVVGVRVVF